jgi:hypothetical protein
MLSLLVAFDRGRRRTRTASPATASAALRATLLHPPTWTNQAALQVLGQCAVLRALGAEGLEHCQVAFVAVVREEHSC